jgi:hypothetical protein
MVKNSFVLKKLLNIAEEIIDDNNPNQIISLTTQIPIALIFNFI